MATSDTFKAELQRASVSETDIKRALQAVLPQLTELKITTWVVSEDGNSMSSQGNPGYCMKTRVSILDSTINNEVGSSFLDNGSYTELREFHSAQVQKSYETLQQNLESLQKLSKIWAKTL
ncbi:MAG TPA: hypothetical protein V6C78_01530 [Crinalium sp.]|jgi:hypothetical protein